MSTSLLQRVAAGDRIAVEHLIARYGGLIVTLARTFSSNPWDVEDAVQDVLLRLWQMVPRFDETAGCEATFVTMIARQRLIGRYRKGRRHPKSLSWSEKCALSTGKSNAVDLRDEVAQISRAMETLCVERQRVLRLAFWEGLSHAEIADRLTLPLGTVKTHARRGLIRIRELLSLSAVKRDAAGTGALSVSLDKD
jgi:RNA polymerase sigma factor (sigma-70 family)